MSSPVAPITPWPFSPAIRRALVVGGTFDPPHRGHTLPPELFRDVALPDAGLVFVPAAASPFKASHVQTTPQHRLAMIRLAIAAIPNAAVWTDELDRTSRGFGSPSYTVDTIRRAKLVAPDVELHLSIGADQALAFHKWREFREIMRLAEIHVMSREACLTNEQFAIEMARSGAWTPEEVGEWECRFDPGGAYPSLAEASATRIRAAIRDRGAFAASQWMELPVCKYIEQHGLYGCPRA